MTFFNDPALEKELAKLSQEGEALTGFEPCEFISTGSLMLDRAFGGGWIRAGHAMISGKPGYGKTSILYTSIYSALRDKLRVAVVDTEGKFREDYFFRCTGKRAERDYFLVRPRTGEVASRYMEAFAKDAVDLIFIDSVAGMVTFKEVESAPEDQQMMVRAKFISSMLNRMKFEVMKNKVAVVWTNQYRDTTDYEVFHPGGRALQHAVSLAAILTKPEIEYQDMKKREFALSMLAKGKTWKNDYARNHHPFEVHIRHLPILMINRAAEIAELAKEFGIFQDSKGEKFNNFNSNAVFQGEVIGRGKSAVEQWLMDPKNAGTAIAIENLIKQNIEAERIGEGKKHDISNANGHDRGSEESTG